MITALLIVIVLLIVLLIVDSILQGRRLRKLAERIDGAELATHDLSDEVENVSDSLSSMIRRLEGRGEP